MIPGENLLDLALDVIQSQTVTYYKFLSRSLNDVGQNVSVYADGVQIEGSLQPIPRSLYEKYGLNLQKVYYVFYALTPIDDVARDVSGDKLEFLGRTYHCESSNGDWYAMDGWRGILCVQI
jgi:hypothetical protein